MVEFHERYSRQRTGATLSDDGQCALGRARVVVVGAGGLGSPVLTYLACAGVGYLRIVDGDSVEESNLNRQFLHAAGDVGLSKADNGARALRSLNPEIEVGAISERLTAQNTDRLLSGADLVVDASDNHETRVLIGTWAETHAVDIVWGVVYGMSGYAGSVIRGTGNSYHHLFPVPADPSTVELPGSAGIVGATCGVVGSVMAMEVIMSLAKPSPTRPARLTYYDGSTGTVALLSPSG